MTRTRPLPNVVALDAFDSRSPNEQAILEQAALLLGVPLNVLLSQRQAALAPPPVSSSESVPLVTTATRALESLAQVAPGM